MWEEKIDNEVLEERGQPEKMRSVIESVTLKKQTVCEAKMREWGGGNGEDNDVMESRGRRDQKGEHKGGRQEEKRKRNEGDWPHVCV